MTPQLLVVFSSPLPVRRDGYRLKSASPQVQVLLVSPACKSVCFLSQHVVRSTRAAHAAPSPHASFYFTHTLSSASDFHSASTRFFVSSSIKISSGHGLVNPSDAHLRVASIPIFDPKSCIRAAWSNVSIGPSENCTSRSGSSAHNVFQTTSL